MKAGLLSYFALVALVAACSKEAPTTSPSAPGAGSALVKSAQGPELTAAPKATAKNEAASNQLMGDKELGELVGRLSERTGDFPSDNFVSNETSYLDVVWALAKPSLHGRAYMGVGPEQNLTYIARMKPSMAYIVDIRRQNMLELMIIRACMETESTRAGFLGCLMSRTVGQGLPEGASVQQLVDRIESSQASKESLAAGTKATIQLMERLGTKASKADEASIGTVRKAFYDKGLSLAYSMEGSARVYPTLGAILTSSSPQNDGGGFLATTEQYAWLRQFVLENRLVPVVGDFGSPLALGRVAEDMKGRGVKLGVFYTSNVEQYLFQDRKYETFLGNIRKMPYDENSLMIRVWFDQGRAHPKQRAGHRTTSLVHEAKGFLDRAEQKPFRSYWEVMQYPSMEQGK